MYTSTGLLFKMLSIPNQGPQIWNQLSGKLQKANTFVEFKLQCKLFLLYFCMNGSVSSRIISKVFAGKISAPSLSEHCVYYELCTLVDRFHKLI